jgi:hypothetical protein
MTSPLHVFTVRWVDWQEPIWFPQEDPEMEFPRGTLVASWIAKSPTTRGAWASAICHKTDPAVLRAQKRENAYRSLMEFLRGNLA